MQYVFYVKKGKEQEFYGASAARIIKRYWEAPHRVSGSNLQGMVVSRGKQARFTGRVVMITDPFREAKKMRNGGILVASMTTPEYVLVMKKAKAIITDHGGMTSHAAVVSRELGIPCIVNTKVATRVLKDGDRVEVDIEKGTIKKL